MLRDLLNKGKVILLLDGLDEICPYYEQPFYEVLLHFILSPMKQIWITLRPHLKDSLEKRFQLKSWELLPYSEINQIDFLVKYWRLRLRRDQDRSTDMKLTEFAQKLIHLISKSIGDLSNILIGIPLQAQMIAEIFFDDIKRNLKTGTTDLDLPEHFDLLWLYREFMIKKITITSSEKGETVSTEKARNEV